jgi:small subunit ribosomal protein S20
MPIIAQASKKLRHDRKRTKQTMSVRKALHDVVKTTRKAPTKKSMSLAFQALDKAAKRNIIHPNKAARLKSRLSKLLAKK